VAKRDDADKRRIVIVGYADGAPAALLATSKTKEIDGLVTIGASAARGDEVLLAQQQRVLDALNLPPQERQARIDLQRRIHAAVTGEGGWEGIPPQVRRQADTPWFRSALQFDPSQVMPKIKKPLLIVHAEQDANVPAEEASRLAALANARKKMPPSDVVRVPAVTHTLAAAGEKSISARVVSAIADWVKKL
jgi:pimeloyl-ACP methyl ester carboxylesterase